MGDGTCTFCNELRGKEKCNFRDLFSVEEFSSRIIHRTENFVAIPGLGPLGGAYLLILPVVHYSCMAVLPDNLQVEFEQFKEEIVEILTRNFQPPILFEHGSADMGKLSAGGSVDHAHIHLVCTSTDLLNELLTFAQSGKFCLDGRLRPKQIERLPELREWPKSGIGYIYYETSQGEKWGFPVTNPIESQFMRRQLAEKLGMSRKAWDWVSFPRRARVKLTWQLLTDALRGRR